jgi:hypothetical protein
MPIDENNIARGRVDWTVELPRIKIKYHFELLENFNQRGKNWIAIIGPGKLRPTYNDDELTIYQRDTDPLILQAMKMGIPFEWGSDNDDDDNGGGDDDDDNYENSESQG